jgi:acyl dehydratase
VPGGLTVALAAVFVAELLEVAGYVGVDYGLDRVRFPAPLAVGTPVRARGLLVEARCEGDALRTVVELTYETEDAGRTPCVAHVVTLLLPLA